MKDNGKKFHFQHDRPEAIDPDLSMSLLFQGDLEDFKEYVTRFPNGVNTKDRNHGNVPLHVASSKGDLSLMSFLMSIGAQINIQDIFGNTPLHYATDKSKRPAVEFLLKQGANPNMQDFRGNSSLHVACVNNDVETVKMLLQFNADPELLDFQNIPPRDKTNSPMIRSFIDRRIHAIHGGDAENGKQTMQWMSFGVGLGVGLGMALAKQQQFMIEHQMQLRMADLGKPKRKGGFNTVGGSEQTSLVMEDRSASTSKHHNNAVVTKGPPERKFL